MVSESRLSVVRCNEFVIVFFYQVVKKGQSPIYRFLCNYDSRYVGHTSQRLQQRIKQHVPKTILQEHISQDPSTLACSCKLIRSFKAETSVSAIGQHLLQNPTCTREYNDNKLQQSKVQLSLFLFPSQLAVWTDGLLLFPFGKGCSVVHANYSFCGTETTLSFSAGPVCSSFSTEICALLQALHWSRKHQQVCQFSSPFIRLSFCLRHPVLSPYFPFAPSFWQICQDCLLYCLLLLGCNGSPDTHFFRQGRG